MRSDLACSRSISASMLRSLPSAVSRNSSMRDSSSAIDFSKSRKAAMGRRGLGGTPRRVNAAWIGERMAAVDQFDQAAAVDMGVDLGGGDVGMAEQELERAEVGAAFEQMGGEGVTQHVRTDPIGRDAGGGGELADELVEADTAQMLLSRRKEPEGIAGHQGRPFGDGCAGAVGDRHEPFLGALAAQNQEGLVRPQCVAREGDEFGRTEAGAVEQLDQSREA